LYFGRFAVVHIGGPSSNQAASLESQPIHQIQLLFGRTLRFPTAGDRVVSSQNMDEEGDSSTSELGSTILPALGGRVRLRSNIAAENSWGKVPSDLVVQCQPSWFDERSREYSDWQKNEWVYYKGCPYCHRSRYEFRTQGCDDSRCLWRRAYPIQDGCSFNGLIEPHKHRDVP
jgi:hypothetical protein